MCQKITRKVKQEKQNQKKMKTVKRKHDSVIGEFYP